MRCGAEKGQGKLAKVNLLKGVENSPCKRSLKRTEGLACPQVFK